MRKPVLLLSLVVFLVVAAILTIGSAADPTGPRPATTIDPDPPRDGPLRTGSAAAVGGRRLASHWIDPYVDVGGPLPQDDDDERSPGPGSSIWARLCWQSSGVPIEGAIVRYATTRLDTVLPTEAEPDARPHLLAPVAVTDRNGEFSLPAVRWRRELFLRIEHGDGLVDVQKVRRLPDGPGRVYQGEYRVHERGAVRGIVVDEDRRPIAGVRVRGVDDPLFRNPRVPEHVAEARIAGAEHFDPSGVVGRGGVSRWARIRDRLLPFPEATTDRDGRFSLSGLRAGRLHLVLQGGQRIGRRTDLVVVAGRTTDVGAIALAKGRPFTVTVSDGSRAVAGVRVAGRPASWRFGPEPRRTDDEGRATLLLPDADPVHVLVQRTPKHPWEFGGSHEFPAAEVLLENIRTRTAVFLSLLGETVTDATVTTVPLLPGFGAIAHGEGRWSFRGLLPGPEFLLVARSPGYAPAVVRGPPARVVHFVPTFPVRFRVVDGRGRPVAGARVRVRPLAHPKYRGFGGTSWGLLEFEPVLGHTDATGDLAVDGVWSTYMRFLADHPDHGETESRKIEPQPRQLIHLRLESFARLRGQVTENGREPSRRYRVVARHTPPPPPLVVHPTQEVVTGIDGSYAFTHLQPGPWTVGVLEPKTPEPAFEAGPGGRVDEALRQFLLQASGFSAGRSGPHVERRFELVGGDEIWADLCVDPESERRSPDLVGVFSVRGDPRADVRVRLRADALGRFSRAPRRARNRFVVTHTGFTDRNGQYRFDGLGAVGPAKLDFAVRAGGEWLTLATREVELAARGTRERLEHRLDVDVAVGGVVLGMFDSRGRALAGRMFRLAGIDGVEGSITLVADPTGTVIHDTLPAGRYRIDARTVDGEPLEFPSPELEVYVDRQTVRDFVAQTSR